MGEPAQLFELDNVARFKRLWENASEAEKNEITRLVTGEEISLSKQQLKQQAIEIIEFLNIKAGKKFRPVDAHLKHIAARLKSGISQQELKAIIVKKCRDWKGSDMEEYLRPATLFNNEKCEQYLGEIG